MRNNWTEDEITVTRFAWKLKDRKDRDDMKAVVQMHLLAWGIVAVLCWVML